MVESAGRVTPDDAFAGATNARVVTSTVPSIERNERTIGSLALRSLASSQAMSVRRVGATGSHDRWLLGAAGACKSCETRRRAGMSGGVAVLSGPRVRLNAFLPSRPRLVRIQCPQVLPVTNYCVREISSRTLMTNWNDGYFNDCCFAHVSRIAAHIYNTPLAPSPFSVGKRRRLIDSRARVLNY